MKLILKNKILSKNNEVAYLSFQPDTEINFKAGQFLMLDNGDFKRAYSIASKPDDELISFYIKKASENGMSKYLTQDIKIADKLDFMWPFWHMILEEDKNTNYFLVSVWSWLWPIFSIYQTLKNSGNYNKIVNIFWERHKDDIVDFVLETMKNFESEDTKNYFHLSREEKDWFKTWYVQSSFEDAINFLWKDNIKVYMCWKPAMVDESIEKLEKLWIDKENIYFEKF